MEPEEDVSEETVMLTRRVRRQKRADAAGSIEGAVDDADSIEDRTIAIDRRRLAGGAAADPIAGGDEGAESLEDRTVVMARRSRADAAGAEPDDGNDDDADSIEDRTIAIDRRRPAGGAAAESEPESESDDGVDDRTHLIEDRTIAVERRRRPAPEEAPLEERTVVISRRRRTDAVDEPAPEDEELYETVRRAPAAVVEQTPAIYKPRAAPRTPHRPPSYPDAVAPTRVLDTDAVSVRKAGRRQSAFAVAAVGGASIVSIVGLVLLGIAVFA